MKVLITGGAGFIGSNLVKICLDHGHEVRVIDDLSTGYRENLLNLDVDFIEGSILDDDALASAVGGIDAVVHLGALGSVPRSIKDPITTHEVNARGSLNVVMASRDAGVSHLSVASSSSVYGMNPAMPKSEREWVRAMSPYAVSKLATEQYTLAAQQSFGMSTMAFRFFNVYGPNQRAGHVYAAVIPVFLDALVNGSPLPVNGDGTNSRDFTFVRTVCEVLVDAFERTVTHPEPVNLAYGTNTSLLDLISQITGVTGIEPSVEFRDPRPGDVKHSMAVNESLTRLFPDIAPVPLAQGLAETYTWFEGVN
ncbi:NAD-dependent epimerase/dehydratase family protein [Dietzia sp. CW19]|uniref:NAD-dependent epimerase/dehydratase family protein n=1 Tax=Dietzia maris TaxID=37915 RepID=A0AAE4U6T9_9ACTN|nr:NAD-dependent epimerase/dehydratase family protein [Dietzia maris]MBB1052545.1 NAD-dependent epimerase/dehydratase family protein [Dietzia sp. CW19]MDV6298603.1 NAD-dependent epimerase/dehydratase family protein [Dietzia maris]